MFVKTFELAGIAGIALSAKNAQEDSEQKELKYHDATGLGERSTSTKHILGFVRNSLMKK